jgi:hemolysin-activating ACP:hemolysin acyltransferase
MTFEQADILCARIIAFLRGLGGPYTEMAEDYLQWAVLSALATGQYVLRIDRRGIRYFACYWMLDREDLAAFLPTDPHQRVRPEKIVGGSLMYVAEVGSRGEPGDAREMIRRLRQREERHGSKGVYWHQPHRAHRVCTWKETADERRA